MSLHPGVNGYPLMRRKLLLVDDDPYSTTQLRKLLESDALSVDAVSSGQEALAAPRMPITAC